MKRCPKCGSGAQRVNIAKGVFATTVGMGGGLLYSLVNRNGAGKIANEIRKNLCPQIKYKCTNPACNHEWSEDNR